MDWWLVFVSSLLGWDAPAVVQWETSSSVEVAIHDAHIELGDCRLHMIVRQDDHAGLHVFSRGRDCPSFLQLGEVAGKAFVEEWSRK